MGIARENDLLFLTRIYFDTVGPDKISIKLWLSEASLMLFTGIGTRNHVGDEDFHLRDGSHGNGDGINRAHHLRSLVIN